LTENDDVCESGCIKPCTACLQGFPPLIRFLTPVVQINMMVVSMLPKAAPLHAVGLTSIAFTHSIANAEPVSMHLPFP